MDTRNESRACVIKLLLEIEPNRSKAKHRKWKVLEKHGWNLLRVIYSARVRFYIRSIEIYIRLIRREERNRVKFRTRSFKARVEAMKFR